MGFKVRPNFKGEEQKFLIGDGTDPYSDHMDGGVVLRKPVNGFIDAELEAEVTSSGRVALKNVAGNKWKGYYISWKSFMVGFKRLTLSRWAWHWVLRGERLADAESPDDFLGLRPDGLYALDGSLTPVLFPLELNPELHACLPNDAPPLRPVSDNGPRFDSLGTLDLVKAAVKLLRESGNLPAQLSEDVVKVRLCLQTWTMVCTLDKIKVIQVLLALRSTLLELQTHSINVDPYMVKDLAEALEARITALAKESEEVAGALDSLRENLSVGGLDQGFRSA